MSSLWPLWSGPLPDTVVMQPLLDVNGWLLGQVGPVSPEPLVVALLAIGTVGMSIKGVFDSILSDDEEASNDDDAEDGLMPEEGGEDLGGLGGLDDDEDSFGEFGDDEFGDMEGGADTDELEHRLDELETEVGSLSSTVNTVRNENEQIAETVDDVEENVRKLLDIYEMVTRGVNPFADDIDAGGMGGPGDGSFGLFDDDEEETDEELEGDIANADAEGFFDEDLVEEEDDFEADTDVGEVFDEEDDLADDPLDDEFDDDFEDDDVGMDDDLDGDADGGDGEGGKSFAELKDEYESGDADWVEGEEPDEAGDFEDDGEMKEDAIDDLTEESADDALADDDLFDEVIDEDAAEEAIDEELPAETDDEPAAKADEEPAAQTDEEPSIHVEEEMQADSEVTESEQSETTSDEAVAETTSSAASAQDESAAEDGKPYLTDLPDGFLADLIVVEWLEFLVAEVGVRETADAIHYYERIDWIDEAVADQLQAYLQGFDADGDRSSLTIDHHTKSLRYVSQLNGGGAESIALEQIPAAAGGGSDGIQR